MDLVDPSSLRLLPQEESQGRSEPIRTSQQDWIETFFHSSGRIYDHSFGIRCLAQSFLEPELQPVLHFLSYVEDTSMLEGRDWPIQVMDVPDPFLRVRYQDLVIGMVQKGRLVIGLHRGSPGLSPLDVEAPRPSRSSVEFSLRTEQRRVITNPPPRSTRLKHGDKIFYIPMGLW